MGNYTVYVNPYIVLGSGGYTKHYYIEGQRIVSKLGGGWDNNGQGPLKAGEGQVDYLGREQKVFDGIVKNLKFLGADGQILTAGKSGKVPPGQVKGSGNIAEKFRYFYHPDHLGSTSYVTDASGEVFQHLEYTAWGETFVEEHSNTDRTPYLFNGKELDEETGLYYYGARYLDSRTCIFLSVDRFTEKHPGFSSYQYAGNNPIMYNDVNGDSLRLNEMTKGAIDAFKTIVQNGSGGYYQANVDSKTGIVSLEENKLIEGKMSDEQSKFVKELTSVLSGNGVATVNATVNSENVIIGDIASNTMDVGDMQKLGTNGKLNAQKTLIHEVVENYDVQVRGLTTQRAHMNASSAENRLGGAILSPLGRYVTPNSSNPNFSTLQVPVITPVNSGSVNVKLHKNNVLHISNNSMSPVLGPLPRK